jgi:hypothetical protein
MSDAHPAASRTPAHKIYKAAVSMPVIRATQVVAIKHAMLGNTVIPRGNMSTR